MADDEKGLERLLALMFQAHPWHGITAGEGAPEVVNAYIEIVPTDAVKYELDKASGHLRLDRPQRFSSFPPTLYGFIPQTFCGDRVAELSREFIGVGGQEIRGDGDPMDICVLAARPGRRARNHTPQRRRLPRALRLAGRPRGRVEADVERVAENGARPSCRANASRRHFQRLRACTTIQPRAPTHIEPTRKSHCASV